MMRKNYGYGLALSVANPGLLGMGLGGRIELTEKVRVAACLIALCFLIFIASSALYSMPEYQPVTPIQVKVQL